MPYVPSLKTDGKSQDRILIDEKVELLAKELVESNTTNFSVLENYKKIFERIGANLITYETGSSPAVSYSGTYEEPLARVIYDVGSKYGYQGAFLGELNYAITRLIQRVP